MSLKSVLKKLLSDGTVQEPRTLVDREGFVTRGKSTTALRTRSRPVVHGTVSVLNGQVLVTDPENDGSYATLIVPSNSMIQVLVNGEQVQGEVVLSESQQVEIELSSIEPSVSYDVLASDDELSVSVKANVVTGVELCLKDCSPITRLELDIEERNTYPHHASPQIILDLLSGHGYDGAIDYLAVNRLCNALGTQQEIVLRGTLPRCSRLSTVRMSATMGADRDTEFRTARCPMVRIGNTCAVVEPEGERVPGVNVYGVPIIPPSVQNDIPRLGDGVMRINEDIVAIRDGRLIFTKHLIDVTPEMVLETEVSEASGEIQFNGNVTIHGSILNGASVKATGTVTVYGDIEASTVYSGQGIFVRDGIYNSNILSGYQRIVYENLSRLLDIAIPELKRFSDEYALMETHALRRSDAQTVIPKIPTILFEKRHANLMSMLEKFASDSFNDLYATHPLCIQLKGIVDSTWLGTQRFKVTRRDTEILLDKFTLLHNQIRVYPKQLNVVRATNVKSSTVRSEGSVIIKKNCHLSTLESGNTVSVQRALLGGFVTAEKAVYVGELGNISGVETSVRVNHPDGYVRVKMNHINTLLDVGGRRKRTYNTERDVRYGGG